MFEKKITQKIEQILSDQKDFSNITIQYYSLFQNHNWFKNLISGGFLKIS